MKKHRNRILCCAVLLLAALLLSGFSGVSGPGLPARPGEELPYTPYGRWTEDEGRAELWIQEYRDGDLTFSLYIPGSAAINNAVAKGAEQGDFLYEDPYLEGVGAAGRLQLDGEVPVLTMGESRLAIPAGTVLRFSRRSEEPDFAALYAPVIEAWQDFELDGGGMENWYADEPGYVHSGVYGTDHYGYQYWDLDRDGSPELILGAIYSAEDTAEDELGAGLYWHNLILDLYTLVDGEPRYVVNSGDRYRYSFTSDGLIYYQGSAGAAYSYSATYELRDGELHMVNGVCVDGGDDACFTVSEDFNPEREGYTLISSEEFYWLWDQMYDLYLYERFAPLQLKPLLVGEA